MTSAKVLGFWFFSEFSLTHSQQIKRMHTHNHKTLKQKKKKWKNQTKTKTYSVESDSSF